MLWGAYLTLAVALIWAVSDGSGIALHALSPISRQVVRSATFVLGVLIAFAAVVFLREVATDHPLSEDYVPYLFFAALGIGGLIYAAGTALWRGSLAQLMRAVGWTLIVLPMTFPSTLTLGLVLAAPLVVTVVTHVPGEPAAKVSRPRVRARWITLTTN
jgi:hypothetical protein